MCQGIPLMTRAEDEPFRAVDDVIAVTVLLRRRLECKGIRPRGRLGKAE